MPGGGSGGGAPAGVVPQAADLHKAAKAGDADECKRLLDAKASINAVNKDGITALIYAAAGGMDRVVGLLLEAGADRSIATHKGNTAHKAATERLSKATPADADRFKKVITLLEAPNAAQMPSRGFLQKPAAAAPATINDPFVSWSFGEAPIAASAFGAKAAMPVFGATKIADSPFAPSGKATRLEP